MKNKVNRIKQVLFSPDIVSDWILEGVTIPERSVRCITGIPKDASFLRGFYDGQRNMFGAIYEHPSWDEVREGDPIPDIQVVIQATFLEEGGEHA